MTSVVHFCLVVDNLPIQTFLISILKCIIRLTSTSCKSKSNYVESRYTLFDFKCPFGIYHPRGLEENLEVANLNVYQRNLNKPLKQECSTTQYQQHDNISLFLNHQLFQVGKIFDILNYNFKISELFDVNLTFSVFLLSDMCPVTGLFHFNCSNSFEYVKLSQEKSMNTEQSFFFCMKRPL